MKVTGIGDTGLLEAERKASIADWSYWLPEPALHKMGRQMNRAFFGVDRTQPARRFDPSWISAADMQAMYDVDSGDA